MGVCVLLVGAEAVGASVGVLGALVLLVVEVFVGVGEHGGEWGESWEPVSSSTWMI